MLQSSRARALVVVLSGIALIVSTMFVVGSQTGRSGAAAAGGCSFITAPKRGSRAVRHVRQSDADAGLA